MDLESSEFELWKFYFKFFNNSLKECQLGHVSCLVSFRTDFRRHFAGSFLEFKLAVEKGDMSRNERIGENGRNGD